MKAAQRTESSSKPAPKPAEKATTQVIETGEAITGSSLGDLLAQLLTELQATGLTAAPIVSDQELPISQPQIVGTWIPAPEVVEQPAEDDIVPMDEPLAALPTPEDSLLAQLLVNLNEPKALRFGLPSALMQPRETAVEAAPIPVVASPPSEQEPTPAKDELVFQLALKVPEPPPPDTQVVELQPVTDTLPDSPPQVLLHREQPEVVKAVEQASQITLPAPTLPVAVQEIEKDGSAVPHVSMPTVSPRAHSSHIEHPAPRPTTTRSTGVAAPQFSPVPAAPSLQKIGILVHGIDQVVRLDIRQSMGSVRVAVHSDDPALAARLRDSLPELLNRLDDRGLQARVTSVLQPSNQMHVSKPDSGNSTGQNPGSWAQDQAREQQRQRNSQRYRQPAAWELQED